MLCSVSRGVPGLEVVLRAARDVYVGQLVFVLQFHVLFSVRPKRHARFSRWWLSGWCSRCLSGPLIMFLDRVAVLETLTQLVLPRT